MGMSDGDTGSDRSDPASPDGGAGGDSDTDTPRESTANSSETVPRADTDTPVNADTPADADGPADEVSTDELSADGGVSESFFRAAFAAHTVPMLVVDPETAVVRDANAAAGDLYDAAPEDLVGGTVPELAGWSSVEPVGPERVVSSDASNPTRFGGDGDPSSGDGPYDSSPSDPEQSSEPDDGGDDPAVPFETGEWVVTQQTTGGERREVEFRMTRVESADEELALAVLEDVTPRRDAETRLAERTARTETLNSLLRHDIRNDMSVLIGTLDRLAGHVDEAGRSELATIRSKANHVVELTETARNVTESLRLDPTERSREPVELKAVLDDELAEARRSYPSAAIRVEGAVPEVTVAADELLDSVFRNLLNNAIQHNDRDEPTVTVCVGTDDEQVTIEVADDGPGVPDDQKAEIFERGERGPTSAGTGLGLYLVGTLLETYGGSVTVGDNKPRGAVFTVTLDRIESPAEVESDDPFGGVADGTE